MERLLLQLIKKKLTSLDKFLPLKYYKLLQFPYLFVPSTKISKKKSPPTNMFCLKSWFPLVPPSLNKGAGQTMLKFQVHLFDPSKVEFLYIRGYKRTKAEALEEEQEQKIN